ncbi:mevalonate kinase [Diplodia corticola]|uniref:Mevalonate kinase n=1 Tax=Diplodia corticola TaxID=236234 RepID=A0A1J9RM89_9PEZI|nr:mevalonate kinase [Diplodia corticola]OJD28717.1 mevalonate kinase [Diplodia corticola]
MERPLAVSQNSKPLAPSFMVSAPGKVIVYGEHAVVYGKAAIAASISLRTYLLVTFPPKSNRIISLHSPDVDLNHTWNIDDLPWHDFSEANQKNQSLDPGLVEALQPHIAAVSSSRPESTRRTHRASAFAFLYLLLSLGSHDLDPCIYAVRSTIPIGAGLGSSASLAVCMATALLLQTGALSIPHQRQNTHESVLQIDRISRWAFVAEMCIHGNPSGVDNTVCSGGKAVMFQRNPPDSAVVTPLRRFPELPLLVVNTREPRSATDEINKVKGLRNSHPAVADRVLSAIHATTESAYQLISAPDFEPTSPAALRHLGDLVAINNGLLVSLGVSHPKLERTRALVDRLGVGWTKLTGAGGGGCAIVLLKKQHVPAGVADEPGAAESRSAAQELLDLERMLADEGLEMLETKLAGDGVGVLWPAVSGAEGGVEIDQKRFLGSKGKEAVENLVGINVAGQSNGWRFWRR